MPAVCQAPFWTLGTVVSTADPPRYGTDVLWRRQTSGAELKQLLKMWSGNVAEQVTGGQVPA